MALRIFRIISLPACQNYSGIENAALLHYTHNVDLIVADECDEGKESSLRDPHRKFSWDL